MGLLRFNKGSIKLCPLPGTEEYVKKVAFWLAKNFLRELGENKNNIADSFYMDEDEIREMNQYNGTIEEFLASYMIGDFSYFSHRNGALEVSINGSVRRKDVYIFHTFSETNIVDFNKNSRKLNLSDQELLLYNTLDAFLEAKVEQVTVVEMNLGQARADRPKGRGSCNLRTFFRNITANGLDHLIVYQIHSIKSLIGIDTTKTSYDNLNGENLLKKYLLRENVKTVENFENVVKKDWIFSSVDAGGKEFAARFAKTFKTPLLVVDKRRNSLTNNIEEITILKPHDLSLEGKIVFVVDDMIDSGSSIVDVCRKYKEFGAKEVNVAIFFGLFSPPAEERLQALVKDGVLNRLIVTDLVKLDDDFYKRNPYIELVDTSYTTSRVIQRTNQGRSLEKYFAPFDAVEYLKTKVEVLDRSLFF